LLHHHRSRPAVIRADGQARHARHALSRLAGALAAALAGAVLLAGLARAAPDGIVAAPPPQRPLVFLTEAANPPYSYMSKSGAIVGFEVELMNALCARMHRACLFKHKDFERLIPALESGRGDAIVSAFENTRERQQRFLLSDPYFHMPVVLAARKEALPLAITPQTLAGKTIGALHDSPYAALAKQRFPRSPLSVYDSQVDADLDLVASRVDLVIGDEKGLRQWLKEAPEARCCAIAGRVRHPGGLAGAGFAVAMRKDEADLKAALDASLKAMRADGSYATLWRKYFTFDLPQS
jgi:ABC-type amino acid transport substrate-binding protein